ncbi:MAG TPA: citrate (Si)-synthase, eukaryotic [Bacteroidetes bacterium]|nr:citrate (Si)-synthase, eukaryotic [Bacteroidota bacterium]
MESLKEKFARIALPQADKVKELAREHGDKVLGEVTIGNVLSGMKGVVSLLTVTSKLDPEEGIRFRGYSIPELHKNLPKLHPEGEPLPEGLFYLMLMGELPDKAQVDMVSRELNMRSQVPKHVFDVIDAMPLTAKPMTIFSAAIIAMATESRFQKAYREGIGKKDIWEPAFEDVMNLVARLPRIASYIYRRLYHQNMQIEADHYLDWAGNFAHMMGYDNEEVKRLFRMYLYIHADHEGGNVSAHTTHLVGSALSNPYYAFGAAMAGLAGPLHGLANQEVIRWLQKMIEEIGYVCDSKERIREYVVKTIESGRVVPGYGHAVLRKTDPRFLVQREFALKYLPNNPLIQAVGCLYEVVPEVLKTYQKIKNPWPNVDAHSGALLLAYGIKEYDFYTVLFGVSRALGVLSQLVWDRVFGLPIERPSSQTLEWFLEQAEKK